METYIPHRRRYSACSTVEFRNTLAVVRLVAIAIESSIRLHSNLHVLCERSEERESVDIECV